MNTPRAIPPPTRLQWSGRTDIGKVRANNEDAFLGMLFDGREIHRLGKIGDASTRQADLAFAVCDGMGGAKAGEHASRIAVEKITTLLPRSFRQAAVGWDADFEDVLTELFAQIHQALALLGKSYEECEGMETTLSLGWFTPGWFYFGHVGDSRIYYLPKGAKEIKQLTEDDTHIAWLQRHGKISEWEARTHPRRNVLQKSLGGGNQFVDPQVGAVAYEPGDIFLICSDGLVEGLYDHHLVEILRSTAVSAADPGPAHRLVEAALEKDGRDNITALVIKVMADGE
jgi:PPM family protein phosphatase